MNRCLRRCRIGSLVGNDLLWHGERELGRSCELNRALLDMDIQ